MPSRKPTPIRRLFSRPSASPLRTLLIRCLLLLGLFTLIFLIFLISKDGIRDQIDGQTSLLDVLYFTAVTVTTIGYGDVVPISEEARFMDTVVVMPLRLFIWLIFFGTAYELVLKQWWETQRMKQLQKKIQGHLIICGFDHEGESAAKEAVAQGRKPEEILVVDLDPARLNRAAELGHIGLAGDSTRERDLEAAGILKAQGALICLGRDDASVLTVLTIRHLNPNLRIICSVKEEENIKLIQQAGASAIVAPSIMGGHLMTGFLGSNRVGDYINDLIKAGGGVLLRERAAGPGDLGKTMRDLAPGLAVRIHRQNQIINFWEPHSIQSGDILLFIDPEV